jgi:hypothetical protein
MRRDLRRLCEQFPGLSAEDCSTAGNRLTGCMVMKFNCHRTCNCTSLEAIIAMAKDIVDALWSSHVSLVDCWRCHEVFDWR